MCSVQAVLPGLVQTPDGGGSERLQPHSTGTLQTSPQVGLGEREALQQNNKSGLAKLFCFGLFSTVSLVDGYCAVFLQCGLFYYNYL